MLINKYLQLAATLFLLFYGYGCSAFTILAKHEIDSGTGHYTAFPNIYTLDDKGQLGFSVTARNSRSHHDSTGERIALVSADCGISWQPTKFLPPEKVFANRQKDVYTRIVANGWRVLGKGELVPDGAYVYSENGKSFIAQGVVEKRSLDNGRSWKISPQSVPKHAVLMNYNLASNLHTSQGTRITAVYYREKNISRGKVLIARKSEEDINWSFVTLPNGNDWPNVGFDETALSELPDGRIIAFMRPDPDNIAYLFYSISNDKGKTWSKPTKT